MAWFGAGIIKGLLITLRNMRRGPVTLQYPLERNEIPERARWAVQMKLDDEGNHKCTSCHACVRACPDAVLALEDVTGEDRSKHIVHFTYELGACMMCGLCVAACPFEAIEMSHNYELSALAPDAMTYPFLTDVPAASPKKARPAAAARKPAGERPAPAAVRGTAAARAPGAAAEVTTDAELTSAPGVAADGEKPQARPPRASAAPRKPRLEAEATPAESSSETAAETESEPVEGGADA